jgi:internalin A
MAEETPEKHREAFAEAEARIRKALETNATDLDLGRLGLAEVPESLGQLTQLQKLDLSFNQLTSITESFGQLAQLQMLYLSGNQLKSIPESLGQLTRLQTLDLSRNQLTSIPEWLGQLTQLQKLDLSFNQLTSIPESFGQLTQLQTLDLYSNQLTSIPEWLGQLTQLQELDLSGNQLTSIPEALGQLTRLRELHLSGNQLTSIPEALGQLTRLRELHLYSNQLTSIPESLGQLTQLQTLVLYGNQLTSIPESLGQLTWLEIVYLSANQLTSIPGSLGQLTQLQAIDLHGNQLTSIPESLGRLTQLQMLYLSDNQLASAPESLGQLTQLQTLVLSDNRLTSIPECLRRLTKLKELYLHGNDVLGLPAEVLGPTWQEVLTKRAKPAKPSDILDYYFRTRGGKRPLNEVKVILLGQGSVGKTSLVKRIVYNTFNKRQRKTDGIFINKDWTVTGKSGKGRVQVNFWDFGGQEIMHATHQFFLTQRTVYLVVLDARKGENEGNIHYWLKIIHSYGGDSPILVVINKCESHFLELNRTRLMKDYPSIKGFLTTSCETGDGIDALKKAITKQIRAMKHVFDPLPVEYFQIKKDLEGLAERKNYIEMDEYYALCAKHKVETRREQDRLLRFLHDLGSVVCFNDPDSPYQLREMSVLNPAWVTKGVYKVLNSTRVAKRRGQLLRSDLAEILSKRSHPAKCYGYIVEMMKKFELCFAIEEGKKWLVAELLPTDEPDVNWPQIDTLDFRYDYEVLPPGIICRFIVRRYENLTDKPTYWRSGSVLSIERCKVLVRSDRDKGRMYVSVSGPNKYRRAALAVVRDEFQRIHATVPGLRPKEMLPMPDTPEVAVAFEHLLTLEQMRQREYIPEGHNRPIVVVDQLERIESIEQRVKRLELREHTPGTKMELHLYDHSQLLMGIERMTDNRQIIEGGTFSQCAIANQQTLNNCLNMIQQTDNPELKAALEKLHGDVASLLTKLDEKRDIEHAAQTRENLESLVTEVSRAKPRRKWYTLSAEGLLEASKFVKEFTGNIAGTIGQIGKLFWPDFKLPESR